MDSSYWLIGTVVLATLASLASGIFSMVRDGEVASFGSAAWMSWRVGLQALAVVLVLATMHGSH